MHFVVLLVGFRFRTSETVTLKMTDDFLSVGTRNCGSFFQRPASAWLGFHNSRQHEQRHFRRDGVEPRTCGRSSSNRYQPFPFLLYEPKINGTSIQTFSRNFSLVASAASLLNALRCKTKASTGRPQTTKMGSPKCGGVKGWVPSV